MRFMHTGDWHLGKSLSDWSLADDQRFTLDALLRLAEDLRPDAIVVAGDVFDRAVPPTTAVERLNDVLGELALRLEIPVVMIAGNHDSPIRLQFLSGVIGRVGLHVVGEVGDEPTGVQIVGRDGVAVVFWPLAYTDPETARGALGRSDIHSHEAVLTAHLESIRERADASARHVVVAHAFVTGAQPSESERPLTVGGSGQVSKDVFDGFDYVALGHLHRPQQVSERVRYAGSLLKYSFAEADHRKSVTVVDLAADGTVEVEEVELPSLHDLVRLRGSFAELMEHPEAAACRDAYVEAFLTGGEAVLDPMERLRGVYPYVLALRRDGSSLDAYSQERPAVRGRSTRELFGDFFADVTGEALSEAQEAEVDAVLTSAAREAREVAS